MLLVKSRPGHTALWLPPAMGGQDPHSPRCSRWVRKASRNGAGPGASWGWVQEGLPALAVDRSKRHALGVY